MRSYHVRDEWCVGFLKDYGDDVVADVPFPLQLLWVSLSVRQECGDVEHHLPTLVLCVHWMATCLRVLGVQTTTETVTQNAKNTQWKVSLCNRTDSWNLNFEISRIQFKYLWSNSHCKSKHNWNYVQLEHLHLDIGGSSLRESTVMCLHYSENFEQNRFTEPVISNIVIIKVYKFR